MVRLIESCICPALALGLFASTAAAKGFTGVVPLTFSKKAWYGNVAIGSGDSTKAYIAGSGTGVTVVSDDYEKGDSAKNQHQEFNSTTTSINNPKNISITYNLWTDTIALSDLSSDFSTKGEVFVVTVPKGTNPFKHPSIGFTYTEGSYFSRICKAGLAECRYGLALGSNGVGELILGKEDTSLIASDLLHFPLGSESFDSQMEVTGQISFNGADGKMAVKKASISFLPSLGRILGPAAEVREVFKVFGITESKDSSDEYIRGTFPCKNANSSRVTLGLASSPHASQLKNFVVDSDQMIYSQLGKGQCESVIVGFDPPGREDPQDTSFWYFGNPFMNGRYMELNIDDKTVGIADLSAKFDNKGGQNAAGDGKLVQSASAMLKCTVLAAGLSLFYLL